MGKVEYKLDWDGKQGSGKGSSTEVSVCEA